MDSISNPCNKPVALEQLYGADAIIVDQIDQGSHVAYSISVNDSEIIRICEQLIVKGAAERVELEHKIATLEARLDALERRT